MPLAILSAGRRRLLWVAVALGVVALAAGHLWYWYLPRERAGRPSGGLAARLLYDDAWDVAVWVPFPHQNLEVVEARVGDLEEWMAAAARLAGGSPPVLPRFGPFRLPPARELTVAGDESGEALAVVVEAYPLVAILARLAGKVASNPLLMGGVVQRGDRTLHVGWRGSAWVLRDGGPEPTLKDGGGGPAPECLALVRARPGLVRVPGGVYRLRRLAGGDLLFSGGREAVLEGWSEEGDAPVTLIRKTGRGAETGLSALLLRPASGDGPSLPVAAVLHRGAGRRWKLPGEEILSFLGRRVRRDEAGGWEVWSMGEESRELALRTASRLRPPAALQEVAGDGFALSMRPAEAHDLLAAVAGVLESIPFVGPRQAEPWRDAATLLAPLTSEERLTLLLARDPDFLELRLDTGP